MNRLVSIGEAATALGVSVTTLRPWEAEGRLTVDHTAGGHRRYDLERLRPLLLRNLPERLYGRRSHKNRKLLDGMRESVAASQC